MKDKNLTLSLIPSHHPYSHDQRPSTVYSLIVLHDWLDQSVFPLHDHLKCYWQLSYILYYDYFSFSSQCTIFPALIIVLLFFFAWFSICLSSNKPQTLFHLWTLPLSHLKHIRHTVRSRPWNHSNLGCLAPRLVIYLLFWDFPSLSSWELP